MALRRPQVDQIRGSAVEAEDEQWVHIGWGTETNA
jgi:hypothetical protein